MKFLIHRVFLFFFLLLSFTTLSLAQPVYEPLNHTLKSYNQFEHDKNDHNGKRQTSLHPNLSNEINGEDGSYYRSYIPVTAKDSLFLLNKKYKERSWFRRKLLLENFIIIDTGLLYITIDPLLNISGGREGQEQIVSGKANNQEHSLLTNTRGLLIKMNIGKKFSMETYAYENQANLPYYADDFVNVYGVVPGQGRVKNFYDEGFDFSQAGAYFSYKPFKNFSVQFGHHKHFVGDGYRSLILSDNSFNMPFLRYNTWFWKNRISYSVMYASMQDLERLPSSNTAEATFYRKGASFHVLDFNVSKWLRLSLYQSNIWKTMNPDGSSTNNYLMYNPIIFTSLLSDAKNYNGLIGGGFKLTPIKKMAVYASAVKHSEGVSKLGTQAGISYFILPTLRIQAEYNHLDANLFGNDTLLTYSHYNQSLGSPVGAGTNEIIVKLNYRFKRLLLEFQANSTGFESPKRDVFITSLNTHSKDQHFALQKSLLIAKFEAAYLINPATNLKVFASYSIRNEDLYDAVISNNSANFYYFGIRTDLRNIYYDF